MLDVKDQMINTAQGDRETIRQAADDIVAYVEGSPWYGLFFRP
jgi:hypothetical protein